MPNRLGQKLGNYQLTKLLGSGGFAEVYLGEHIHLATKAAIKVLTGSLLPQDEQNFLIEARSIAQLTHPHIVRLLDFGIESGVSYMVMEYAPHGTLRDRHPHGTQLSLPVVVSYVNQLTDALQYAHDQKIIHRDIKPENMLVGTKNEILLSDFGIAVIAKSALSQSTKDIVGTFEYMAPEQWRGKPLTASDQYSLACVVYEWICGANVFSGSLVELMTQHVNDQPPPLRAKVPSLSPAVEQVILKALAKDPQQRFASVQEFAQALEQASQPGQSILSKKQTSTSSQQEPQAVPTVYSSIPPTQPVGQSRSNVKVGTILYTYTNKRLSHIYNLIWSSDSTHLAFYGDGISHIWDITATQERPNNFLARLSLKDPLPSEGKIFTYRDPLSNPRAMAWSPDGRQIAMAIDTTDKNLNSRELVQVREVTTGTQIITYEGHITDIYAVEWSPDGKQIASMDEDGNLHVWDVVTRHASFIRKFRKIAEFGLKKEKLSWLPQGTLWLPQGLLLIFASQQAVEVWEALTERNLISFSVGFSEHGSVVSWSPNGKYFALSAGKYSTSISIWDIDTGKCVFTYPNHSGEIRSIAWSPRGDRIASASEDGTVQLWDAFTGRNVFTYHRNIICLAWSADSTRIASATDNSVEVWQAL